MRRLIVFRTTVKLAHITWYFLTAVRQTMIALILMEVAQTTMTDGDGVASRRRTDVERLTERLENGVINVKYASQHETAIHRLVTIEDILGDEYDLDRLRDLVQADREGRCVVIHPNSVTDDDYKIICGKINAEDIHLRKMRNVHEKHK